MKVLVMDGVSGEGLAPLRRTPGIEVVTGGKMSGEELAEVISEYDGLIVRSATRVTAALLERAALLKVVGRAGVGVDNIDLEAATRRGVLVVNAPDGNTIAATEHTIAMMLALARNIAQAAGKMREGVWDKKAFLGVELRKKVLGIMGLGRIGSAVARRAQALEMEVVAYDPYINEEKAAGMAVELVGPEELYRRSDVITIHMPKTRESERLIDQRAFSMMKPGVRIINCARGGIIDEEALYRAMLEGRVAGAALDVFEKEPNTASPLFELPNFIATPHLGASTAEAQISVAADVSEELASFLTGGLVRNAVNMPSVSPKTMALAGPCLGLAEKLGRFQACLAAGRVKRVEVAYSGGLSGQEVAPLTTAVVKGLLDPILQETVNFINAQLLARSRGIQVLQAEGSLDGGYSNLITVRVQTDRGESTLSGTLFSDGGPRIVRIDGYRIDVVPEGNIIYVQHVDKPRVAGSVGILIGDHNINIATMQVGRREAGGRAIMMITVDGEVNGETLRGIAGIDGVLDVKLVRL